MTCNCTDIGVVIGAAVAGGLITAILIGVVSLWRG